MSEVRLIDANALMEKFGDVSLMLRMNGFLDSVGEAEIISMIGNAPTIEPKPERINIGAVKEYDNGMVAMTKETFDEYHRIAVSEAVRNCGVKMKGESDAEDSM